MTRSLPDTTLAKNAKTAFHAPYKVWFPTRGTPRLTTIASLGLKLKLDLPFESWATRRLYNGVTLPSSTTTSCRRILAPPHSLSTDSIFLDRPFAPIFLVFYCSPHSVTTISASLADLTDMCRRRSDDCSSSGTSMQTGGTNCKTDETDTGVAICGPRD
jgi:hypothetical protein